MNPLDSNQGCVDLLVDRHVRDGRGDYPALIEIGPSGRRSVSYRKLQQLTFAAAIDLNLHLAGSRTQQRIALVGGATLENTVYWLAAMRSGHLPFMVHPALPQGHYRNLWEDFDPKVILADPTVDGSNLRAPFEPMSSIEDLDNLEVGPVETSEISRLAADLDLRPALVLATSGSTGKPKLCVHSHRSFWEFERTVSRPLWNIRAEDRVLASTGPFFSFGLQGLHVPLSRGGTAIMLPQWKQHTDFLEVIEAEKVSVFLAVPTLYHLLMSRAEREYQLEHLRLSLSAGERLPPVVRRRWQAWSGAQILDSIGTTETFAPYLSELAGAEGALQKVEGFRYTETPHGDGGDISLSLSQGCLMLGYLAPATGELQTAKQPFATSDLFTRGNDGFHFISRDSERIKVAGHWVSPQELEEFLLTDKRVVKAAALPIETDEGLTRLRAYVVANNSGYSATALVNDLMKRIREHLHPRALCPDRIELVEDIASTPSGKLKRQELRSFIGQQTARAGVVLA
ncbi:aryl-CoA ligase [Microbulbifer sp. A4B17]|uniref:AMP-binding protein n=1 Tax=Microbulbifer sp. A4B17 TaxID=359370 RepID=UPI000D52F19D|nr:AMP-binding protein [Microbulbifer sp. A4B17]AWF79665.1 aryl-CoA ligase [Microbulbifer sp. A4B17]